MELDENKIKCFEEENLNEILNQMNLTNKNVFIEEKAKEMLLAIGNEFIDTVLDKSFQMILKKGSKLDQNDLKYIIEKQYGISIQSSKNKLEKET